MLAPKKLIAAISAPGAKGAIEETAPTQHALVVFVDRDGKEGDAAYPIPAQNDTGLGAQVRKRRLDRWLDRPVRASGSTPVFLLIMLGLLIWAFLGIPYSKSTDWAVIISDVQAIVSCFFDSLLMRQQLNGYGRMLRVSATLRSRGLGIRRMAREIVRRGGDKAVDKTKFGNVQPAEFAAHLPNERLVGRISTLVSQGVGHIVTIGLFWAGILVWIGFGHYMEWSDAWQLYINSATSALMMFIFSFLANIRERHHNFTEKCLDLIFDLDATVERKLRAITGDIDPNPAVIIPAPKVGRLQRAIFYYADIVGTLVGIAILIIVIVVWLCIGPVMAFDSNWWLLIGTYAGLIGLNDGFVLRNVQARFHDYEYTALEEALLDDQNVLMIANIPDPRMEHVQLNSVNYWLSVKVGDICAHEITVVLGVLLIVGLIIGASVMKWTTTGQLLCNIPPSIIESFFMMILIKGHNISDSRRHVDLHNMYLRRLRLLAYVPIICSADISAAGFTRPEVAGLPTIVRNDSCAIDSHRTL